MESIEKSPQRLLAELQKTRADLQILVKNLTDLSEKIDEIIPKKYTPTTRFLLEDRTRVITQLYDTILRYKSEVSKLIQKEIELVRELYQTEDVTVDDISKLSKEKIEEILKKYDNMLKEVNFNEQ